MKLLELLLKLLTKKQPDGMSNPWNENDGTPAAQESMRTDGGPMPYKPQIDLQACLVKMNVKDRARMAAMRNMPAESEEDLDHTQREIVAYCEFELDKLRRSTNERLRHFLLERQGINIATIKSSMNDVAVMCELSIARLKAKAMEVIKEKQCEAIKARSELMDFMIANDLTRAAHYPESPFKHFANIGYVIGFETVFNMAFFAVDKGFKESILIAFIAAVANTFLAMFAGYFPFRWINHVNTLKSRFGLVLGGLWVVLLLAFNALLANYRLSLSGTVDLKSETIIFGMEFLNSAAQDPQGRAVQSVVLLMIGILAGLYACRRGYTANDAYPGYKDVTEQAKNSRLELERSVHSFQDEINHIVDRALHDIDLSLTLAERENNRFIRLLNDSILAHKEFVDQADRIEGVCNALLKAYRDINRTARNAPPPAYFLLEHVLDKEISPPLLVPDGEISSLNKSTLVAMSESASSLRQKLREVNETEQKEAANILAIVESKLKDSLAPPTPQGEPPLKDRPSRKSTATPQPVAYDEIVAQTHAKGNGHDSPPIPAST